MSDLIDRQATIDIVTFECGEWQGLAKEIAKQISALPSAEPTIVQCKDCKHWNLQVGNVKGDGLGSCDFHNVNLVTGEGFCYWAERRGGTE